MTSATEGKECGGESSFHSSAVARQRGRSRRAQQTDRMRRLGMLMVGDENDALRGAKGWFAGFTQGLAELGWTDGRNLRMDVRWVGDSVDRARIYAKELVDQPFGLAAQDVERNTCGSASRHFFPSLFAAPRTGCLQY